MPRRGGLLILLLLLLCCLLASVSVERSRLLAPARPVWWLGQHPLCSEPQLHPLYGGEQWRSLRDYHRWRLAKDRRLRFCGHEILAGQSYYELPFQHHEHGRAVQYTPRKWRLESGRWEGCLARHHCRLRAGRSDVLCGEERSSLHPAVILIVDASQTPSNGHEGP
jgi:hypothetical protein